MFRRRRLVALLFAVLLAGCGSGSGTEEDRGVPSGPADAGTTESSTTVPTPYGGAP